MVTAPSTSNPDLSSYPLDGQINVDRIPHQQLKRTHLQFSEALPSQAAWDPRKKVKKVHTTVSATRSQEVEDLHSLHMVQLARASRNACAARLQYRRLRLQEIEVMRTIGIDECKEAEACLRRADEELEELNLLHPNVTALENSGIRLFSAGDDNNSDTERDYRSPTPSSDHDNDIDT